MGLIKLPFTLSELKKDPFVALSFLLLTYVVWDIFIKRTDDLEYSRKETEVARKERDKALQDKDDLYKAMLYYRGISIEQGTEMEKLDSIVNKKIGEKARQIVK